jgi:hypothetical protein
MFVRGRLRIYHSRSIKYTSTAVRSTWLARIRWLPRSFPQIFCSYLGSIASQCSGIWCESTFKPWNGSTFKPWSRSSFKNWCRAALKALCLRVPKVHGWLLRRWCFNSLSGRFIFFIAGIGIIRVPVLLVFVALLPLSLTSF